MTRVCGGCLLEKPTTDFYPKRYKSGRKTYSLKEYQCRVCQSKRLKTYARTLEGRYSHFKRYLKKTGYESALTKEQFIDLATKPCHYCARITNNSGIGLDRIDHTSTMYAVSTVLPCCGECNRMRGKYLTVAETEVAVRALWEFRNVKR
jgi:hypothetical protein